MSQPWIARIEKDGQVVATLQADGGWTAASEPTAHLLNLDFNPKKMGGLAFVLPFGHHAASMAAARLGGKAVFSKPPGPAVPGLIS